MRGDAAFALATGLLVYYMFYGLFLYFSADVLLNAETAQGRAVRDSLCVITESSGNALLDGLNSAWNGASCIIRTFTAVFGYAATSTDPTLQLTMFGPLGVLFLFALIKTLIRGDG